MAATGLNRTAWAPRWVLVLACVVGGAWAGFGDQLWGPPYSIHAWRATDALVQARTYHREGMRFFQPRLNNYGLGEQGRAVGEAPVLPYLAAGLYFIFGEEPGILRLLTLLLTLAGLVALQRMAFRLWGDAWLATALPLLLVSSPMLAYYANNTLPNVPALACSWLGLYALERFISLRTTRWFALTVAWCTLAGLLKQTHLVLQLLLAGVFLLESLGWLPSTQGATSSTVRTWRVWWGRVHRPRVGISALGLAIVGGWIAYSGWYNHHYHSGYFTTSFRGIWGVGQAQFQQVLYAVSVYWSPHYASLAGYAAAALGLWVLWLRLPGSPGRAMEKTGLLPFWWALGFVASLLTLAIPILWFEQLRDHDYYLLDALVYLTPVLVLAGGYLVQQVPQLVKHPVFRAGVVLLLLASFVQTRFIYRLRYTDQYENRRVGGALFHNPEGLQAALEAQGVGKNDPVVCIPEYSPLPLYLLDRDGWNGHGYTPTDTTYLARHMEAGAKWVVVTDTSILHDDALRGRLPRPTLVWDAPNGSTALVFGLPRH